jgi:esterase/lipase superfamily enzyme/Tfp pilus assembly protein PilF
MFVFVWRQLVPILAIALLAGSLAAGTHAQPGDDLAALNKQVVELVNAGKHAEALPLAERAVKVTEEQLGPDHPDGRQSLTRLASLYESQGRYADAEPLLKRSLAIAEKALGPDHPDVGSALARLASLYQFQRRYADAEPLLKRSLAVTEEKLGPDHPDVRESLARLKSLYESRGRHEDVEALLKRSLAIREKAIGPDHPGSSLTDLASLYQSQGRYADAEPLLKRSLAIREKALGPDHPDVGSALASLASLYQSQGRYADAEPLLERSLAIFEKTFGPDHPDVSSSLAGLAELYQSQGRYADAEPLLKRSLAITEKTLGPDHPHVAVSLHNLAWVYRSQGNHKDAEDHYKRSLAIFDKALGPDHPGVLLTTTNLGAFLKSEGRLDDAEPLLKRAVDGGRKALGAEHPQVIEASIHLAELYCLQGRVTEARELFAQAGATKAVDLKEFPVYFATNRKRDPKQKRIAFGSERELGALAMGVVKVVVPPPPPSAAQRGSGQEQRAETRLGDPGQLSIHPVEPASADQLVRAARERLFGARAYLGQALVFVHGFNMTFDNAIRRAGQLAYDLGFDGPVFAFSWPSAGQTSAYMGDRESVQVSADALREFIETVVAETKAKRIHIIAHSMGNVALNGALLALAPETLAKLNIGEMVLASPDLDPDLFERTYKRIQKRGATSTIYAASNDRALQFASWLKGNPPLGYIPSNGPERLVAGTDLIDITAVNTDFFSLISLNHDTYANSPALIADLRRLLKEGQRPPDTRTPALVKVPVKAGIYWRYKAP